MKRSIRKISRGKLLYRSALMLAACVLFYACGRDDGSLPVKNWHILHNQKGSLSEIKTEREWQWRSIDIPSTFKLSYRPVEWLQYVWLKGEFFIDRDPSKLYGISLGRVFYTDDVYINDVLIGSETEKDITIMCHPRNYAIPGGVLKKGMNTVYIRIGMFGNEYGGLTSAVLIQSEQAFKRTVLVGNIFLLHVPLAILTTAFIIVILLMTFYLWNKNEKLFLYSSLGVLIYIIYLGSMFYPFTGIGFLFVRFIHLTTVQFILIVLLLIIQSLYEVYVTNYNRILIPVLLLTALANLISLVFVYRVDVAYTHYIGSLIGVATIFVNIPLAVRLIVRLNRLKPNSFNYYFLMFISIAGGLVILLELFLSNLRGRFSYVLAMYYAILLFIMFSVLFARDVMQKNSQLALLYEKLKDEETVINKSSREKLDKIIQFIKDNYTSDLSREGMAAAAGMNPNYMSTLFNKYTGMKVNEYINKLRIEEAAKRLSDKEAKIIEIAFLVGFESLTTFNRVFKTITGKTPTEYRELQ